MCLQHCSYSLGQWPVTFGLSLYESPSTNHWSGLFFIYNKNFWCFWPRFCTSKAILGRRQPGRIRWILLWIMLLAQDRSLDLLASSTTVPRMPPAVCCDINSSWFNSITSTSMISFNTGAFIIKNSGTIMWLDTISVFQPFVLYIRYICTSSLGWIDWWIEEWMDGYIDKWIDDVRYIDTFSDPNSMVQDFFVQYPGALVEHSHLLSQWYVPVSE